jgi:hypothetical protein
MPLGGSSQDPQSKIHNIRNELRVRLNLVESAHNAAAMRSGPRVSEDQLHQASAPISRALSAVFLAAPSGATLNIVTSKAVPGFNS